jgi:RNA polymerase sigma-70 factor (ECF subfamily)
MTIDRIEPSSHHLSQTGHRRNGPGRGTGLDRRPTAAGSAKDVPMKVLTEHSSSAKSLPTRNKSFTVNNRTGEKTQTTTLGDVLYAKSKPAVSEEYWVTLVQSIAAGDQMALHALYEMAHRIVFTLMVRLTCSQETAEELTIDVFHDIWRRAARYEAENGTVLAWIMNQARSRGIDRLRLENRKKRTHAGDTEPPGEVAANPHDVIELREQAEVLRKALSELTSDERQAIEATFFAGLTHVEAAERLSQPLGTIKTRIRSGIHKLRRTLAAEAGKQ